MSDDEESLERADFSAFVASNRARWLRLYDAGGGRRRGAPFCWPGFLAPQAWFLYRKMYLWAALVSAGPLLLAYVQKFYWLDWGASIIGAFGLRFYPAYARRTIARIRATVPDDVEARALIVRAGGVSRVGAAIGLAFAFSAFVMSLKSAAPHLFGPR